MEMDMGHGPIMANQLLLLMQVVKGMDLIGWNSQTVKVGMWWVFLINFIETSSCSDFLAKDPNK